MFPGLKKTFPPRKNPWNEGFLSTEAPERF